jgi:Glyoxalase superfamily protein
VVLTEVRDIHALVAELHGKGYGFFNAGVEPGPVENMLSTELIDPFANLIRFFERGRNT